MPTLVLKSFKSLLFLLFSLITIYYLLITLSSPTLAQVTQKWPSDTGAANPEPATFKDLERVFSNILTVAFALGGLAAFVMLIIGGFRFLTSGGDPKATAQAQGTLTWAIAGLLFFIGAWFILRFIKEFTGVDVTTFKIPGAE